MGGREGKSCSGFVRYTDRIKPFGSSVYSVGTSQVDMKKLTTHVHIFLLQLEAYWIHCRFCFPHSNADIRGCDFKT